ncbi:MAG: ECF RNA polymerase sigma-E factor [Phycisphaerae bacterium]|nr:ECF RNA polymerase sigma-E factor [Phycisphaerae bacterium]
MNDHPVNSEEQADLQACRRGDPEAFHRLMGRYQQELARYLWRFSRQSRVCEELVQEVLVEAYFALRNFRGESTLGHWLRRIATRIGYRYWQQRDRQRRREGGSAMELEQVAEQPLMKQDTLEAAEQWNRLLEPLATRERLVLTLQYLEELSVIEIAGLTGWSPSAVKVLAHRARQKLKITLQESQHDD